MITAINQSGTILHSHGIEVYHKHTPLAAIEHDAGFNLQKWAWIEQKDSPEAFVKVRIVDDKSFNDMVLVEYENGYKVRIQISRHDRLHQHIIGRKNTQG